MQCLHVPVNVMGRVKYNDCARMIVDICTAWVATWAVQIWEELCTCRFDRGNFIVELLNNTLVVHISNSFLLDAKYDSQL